MKNIILPLLAFLPVFTYAQNSFKAIVKDSETKEVLVGASALLFGTKNGAIADVTGTLEIRNIPDGKQVIVLSYIGYETKSDTFVFPLKNSEPLVVFLSPDESDLEEVVINSTRTSRTFANTPTRVETIDMEEIDEKSNMRPSNVSMMLHESTGIQVQQTSASSANMSIRIQGLDGKYTQILKDGFPTYGGFSGGMSLMDIPPLDLKQVEVIKGPASTLYGGDAIAGVVNFITREPSEKDHVSMILNQTSALGTDLGSFITNRKEKIGTTILATFHNQNAYDVDGDDFTELPESREFAIAPKLFFFINDSTVLSIGNTTNSNDRVGGDVFVINGLPDSSHTYFEKNRSIRSSMQVKFDTKLKHNARFTIRQSGSWFNRKLEIPTYYFEGSQYNSYTDVSFLINTSMHTLVTGANLIYDHFDENRNISGQNRDYRFLTAGIYIQDNYDITKKLLTELGIRGDYTNEYGGFVLPRISALYKFSDNFTSRFSAGMGYKTPTIFTERTEELFYKDVLQISSAAVAEHSYGGTFDLNLKIPVTDGFFIGINQMFFRTRIDKPLVLHNDSLQNHYYVNMDQPVLSSGFETNLKFIFSPFKLFVGYTYTDARAAYQEGDRNIVLVPKNKLNLALLCEREHHYKIGLEGYFSDRQHLSDGTMSPSFWEFGAFIEKTIRNFGLFINFENFTDTRQNKLSPVVNLPHTAPTFNEIYTHTEGFVINGGIKINL